MLVSFKFTTCESLWEKKSPKKYRLFWEIPQALSGTTSWSFL